MSNVSYFLARPHPRSLMRPPAARSALAGRHGRPLRCPALPRLLEYFVDVAHEIEVLLWNLVVFAFRDFLEPANGLGNRHVLAFEAGELLRHEEGLREELLNL